MREAETTMIRLKEGVIVRRSEDEIEKQNSGDCVHKKLACRKRIRNIIIFVCRVIIGCLFLKVDDIYSNDINMEARSNFLKLNFINCGSFISN